MIVLAEIVLATVAYHVPFSSGANQPLTWCSNGVKIEDVPGKIWVIDGEYDKVIVKAGAGEYANSVYVRPLPGLGAYADTNGNFKFDPTGPGGDKDISHVIVCPKQGSSPSPSPSTSSPSPTASQTPEPTFTQSPSPTRTAPTPVEQQDQIDRNEADQPTLAETGFHAGGTAAAGLALGLLGWALTRFRRE